MMASKGLIAVILVWGFSSLMALAFQCSIPHPWDSAGKCINQVCYSLHIRRLYPDRTYLESIVRIVFRSQHHHRRRPHPTPLHSFLEGVSIMVEEMEDRGSLCSEDRRLRGIRCPNTLF